MNYNIYHSRRELEALERHGLGNLRRHLGEILVGGVNSDQHNVLLRRILRNGLFLIGFLRSRSVFIAPISQYRSRNCGGGGGGSEMRLGVLRGVLSLSVAIEEMLDAELGRRLRLIAVMVRFLDGR